MTTNRLTCLILYVIVQVMIIKRFR